MTKKILIALSTLVLGACSGSNKAGSNDAQSKAGAKQIVLSTTQLNYTEGDMVHLQVTLDAPVDLGANLVWTVTEAGARFRSASGALVIPPHGQGIDLDLESVANHIFDGVQNFTVEVTDQQGHLTKGSITLPLNDVDTQPYLSISDTDGTTGSILDFPVHLSAATSQDVTVQWQTQNATATAGQDFVGASGTLRIPAGHTTGNVSVVSYSHYPLPTDTDKTFVVQLGTVTVARLSDLTATGTLHPSTPVPASVGFAEVGNTTTEGAHGFEIPVQLSTATLQDVHVQFVVSGRAVSGQQYQIPASEIVIPAGQVFGTLHVDLIQDGMYEDTRTLHVAMVSSLNAGLSNQTNYDLDIQNIDPIPAVSIQDSLANEGSPISFSLSLDQLSDVDTLVSVKTTSGTAHEGQFTPLLATVRVPKGQTIAQVPVQTIHDGIYSGRPQFNLSIAQAINATVQRGTASGTIVDTDPKPGAHFTSASQIISAATSDVVVTAALSTAANVDVVIPFFIGGTAMPGIDHNLAQTSLRIPAGSVSGNISFKVFTHGPPTKTITLQMGAPDNADLSGQTQHTVQF